MTKKKKKTEPKRTKVDELVDEGKCPKRDDGIHCECWWDGDKGCCSCNAPALTIEKQREYGMLD